MWLQLILATDRSGANACETLLLTMGAAAVTMQDGADQPLYEPAVGERPVWHDTRVTGLFPAEIDPKHLEVLLELLSDPAPPARFEWLEDEDWERVWMDRFQPAQFGDKLWICPSWATPPDAGAVNLMLDPGLAFGTGTHPTTALCLAWLATYKLEGLEVVDYGCGSGILGIAAALLGAQHVRAVDNDPQALIATRQNAENNALAANKLDCQAPQEFDRSRQCDLVLANILAQPLLELAEMFSGLLPTGGTLCLSGILDSQQDTIAEGYRQWFEITEARQQENWLQLSLRRL